MSRLVLMLFCLFAVLFLNSVECAPYSELSDSEFEKRRDESVKQLIEAENLTCDNVKAFCYRGQTVKTDIADEMARLACQIILETYVCEDKKV